VGCGHSASFDVPRALSVSAVAEQPLTGRRTFMLRQLRGPITTRDG